jgi:hypothetical protein
MTNFDDFFNGAAGVERTLALCKTEQVLILPKADPLLGTHYF